MTPQRRPSSLLTRHFFNGLFDFGVLSEAGASSFARTLVATCGIFAAAGLLLTRIFLTKYRVLDGLEGPEAYRAALLGDHGFIIAIPMWVVAFVTVLAGHALFPDETDFRVLMALPVTRRLVFGTKLAALALFTGMFILAAHGALAPLFVLTAMGRWAEATLPLQVVAFVLASLLGSAFAILAVVAVHGLLMLFASRRRVLTASAALRSVMLCALVTSLPLLARLPALGDSITTGALWIYTAPPVWFVGVERWLIGDRRHTFATLAVIAGIGLGAAGIIASSAYTILYRRFDRVMRPPAERRGPRTRSRSWTRRGSGDAAAGVGAAIGAFTMTTLRRSVLHQGVVVALSSVGVGLVVNSLVASGMTAWWARNEPGAGLADAVIWAPFALMFAGVLAMRASLALPLELRANWVFRLTEQETTRVQQLEAAARAVRRWGVFLPVGLMLPLQWMVLGPSAMTAAIVSLLHGLVFAELVMRDWRRIPFTCSYMPGKAFVPQTVLRGAGSFLLFTTVGALLVRISAVSLPVAASVAFILSVLVAGLRWRRLSEARLVTLTFEDELPSELHPLRLSTD